MNKCIMRMKVPMRCSDCDAGQRTKSGIRCPIASRQVGFSCVTGAGNVGLPHYCPIVRALPENHGRLGDLDELWNLMCHYDDYYGAKEAHDVDLISRDSICYAIEDAPTIVPADTAERSET